MKQKWYKQSVSFLNTNGILVMCTKHVCDGKIKAFWLLHILFISFSGRFWKRRWSIKKFHFSQRLCDLWNIKSEYTLLHSYCYVHWGRGKEAGAFKAVGFHEYDEKVRLFLYLSLLWGVDTCSILGYILYHFVPILEYLLWMLLT